VGVAFTRKGVWAMSFGNLIDSCHHSSVYGFSFFCFFASFFSVEGGGEGIGVVSRDWSEIRQHRFHSLNCLGHIAVTGDEDNRHVCPFHRNPLFAARGIKAGKRSVKNPAPRNRVPGRLRNSRADGSVSASHPSQRMCNSGDSRTGTTTTSTIGVLARMVDHPNSRPSAGAAFPYCIHSILRELAGALERYRRQVAIYATAISKATASSCDSFLFRV
jgi:hypothetical protein